MATFDLEIRNSPNRRDECPIVLRVTSNRKITRKNTGIRVEKKYWDQNKSKVKSSHPNSVEYNITLSDILNKATSSHAVKMRENLHVGGKEIVDGIFKSHDFKEIMQKQIDELSTPQKFHTQKKYKSLLNIISDFHKGPLMIESITPFFLTSFRKHLQESGNSHNTIISRISVLRTIFKASGLKIPSPFEEYTIGTFRPSGDEPLTMEEIHKIWNFKTTIKTEQQARDLFLFSFYAAGMRSGDVLSLEWSEIGKDAITYYPDKVKGTTGAKLIIPLNEKTSTLLSNYDRSTETVFNILKKPAGTIDRVKEIETRQTMINASLKSIQRKTEISKTLKFKLARTTFAHIANQKSNRNIYGIKQAMGHSKIATTEIYLGNDISAIKELLKATYED